MKLSSTICFSILSSLAATKVSGLVLPNFKDIPESIVDSQELVSTTDDISNSIMSLNYNMGNGSNFYSSGIVSDISGGSIIYLTNVTIKPMIMNWNSITNVYSVGLFNSISNNAKLGFKDLDLAVEFHGNYSNSIYDLAAFISFSSINMTFENCNVSVINDV